MINPKCPEMSNRAVSLSGTLQEDTEQDDSDPPSPVAATGKTPVVELDCNWAKSPMVKNRWNAQPGFWNRKPGFSWVPRFFSGFGARMYII